MNALVYGQKHWYLFPPYKYHGPVDVPMTEWVQTWYSRLSNTTGRSALLQCTQQSGELLYIPSNYVHGVLNLQFSVGVAVEVSFVDFDSSTIFLQPHIYTFCW